MTTYYAKLEPSEDGGWYVWLPDWPEVCVTVKQQADARSELQVVFDEVTNDWRFPWPQSKHYSPICVQPAAK